MTAKKTAKAKAPAKKKAPKITKKSAEQRIASGEVDADHLVKWGDLKNLK